MAKFSTPAQIVATFPELDKKIAELNGSAVLLNAAADRCDDSAALLLERIGQAQSVSDTLRDLINRATDLTGDSS